MADRVPACGVDLRRAALFAQRKKFNGIDFIEVLDDQRSLCVHFFGEVPHGLTAGNLRLSGGARIRDIAIVKVSTEHAADDDHDDCLRILLDKTGDFSVYTLCLVGVRGFDPRYLCADFHFRIDCPRDIDCKDGTPCAHADKPTPEISYLAKDYASFRQLIFDRLATTMPDWRERHVPDLGVTLVELLAYAADHLSYYQDAVATEAYLDTARQRISVRRHARLVDYRMHDGLNARALVYVHVGGDSPEIDAGDFYFTAGGEVFEPVRALHAKLRFWTAQNEMHFYTWGDAECCLAKGTTRATLIGSQLHLKAGQVLIFEEVIGLRTGNPADADPARRHAVMLTGATASRDPLSGTALTEIAWSMEDALPFALCLSARLDAPLCTRIGGISVARGNVVLADHGRDAREQAGTVGELETAGDCACEGSIVEMRSVPAPLKVTLREAPLTFADPLAIMSAASLFERDPRQGRPQLSLLAWDDPEDPFGAHRQWEPRGDLFDSGAVDQHVVAELDDQGRAHLRFGDGRHGRQPPAGLSFDAIYRVGNGIAGNVGAEAISKLVLRNARWDIEIAVRNPLPARGGVEPESSNEAKLLAPDGFRAELRRAITEDDYAAIAGRHRALQRAAASLRWSGSWYEMRVGVDPLGSEAPTAALLASVEALLHPYRRIGHDVRVVAAGYVPLDLELTVCVSPHYTRGAVRGALLQAFARYFDPGQLTFGMPVLQSRLVALAQAVGGVEHVAVTRLQRLREPLTAVPALLPIGPMEIAQLDNDPNFPEHGKLELAMRGGR